MATLSRGHYPDYPEQGSVPAEGGLPLRELITILRRRRRLIFWVVVLLTAVATLIGLQVTKTYTASALVMIESRENRIIDLEEVAQGLSPDAASIETQIKFIQSDENLGRVVERLYLHADPAFVPRQGPAATADGPLRLVAGWLPDRWLIAAGLAEESEYLERKPDWEALTQRAVDALRSQLKVSQSGHSYVLSVSFTATDPGRAARLTNAVADAYVAGQLEGKLAATKRASAWLAERVEEFRDRVLTSEEAIQEYRAANGLVDVSGSPLDAQQIAALTAELIDARAEQATKEARLRRVRELQAAAGAGGASETAVDVLSSPMIMSLRQQELELLREESYLLQEFGERHPRIVQLKAEKARIADRIQQEIGNAVRNLENDIAVARNREQALRDSLGEAQGRSVLGGHAAVQLRELEREAAANRSLYETFLIRLKETEEQQQIIEPDARVISPAKAPGAPSSPSPKLFAAVGLTASIVLGSILALLLEQLDGSLRSGRQLEELLQLPALGLVPRVTELRRDQRLHGYLFDKPHSTYAEGVRALHTQIRLAELDRPPKVILITSALPGEGKTSLAVSLAAFAAQLEQRVLLVDLDLRRPKIAHEFGLHPETGIVELVAGMAQLADVVHTDEETGIDLLLVDGAHGNPTALLASQRLGAVLDEARGRYDLVVIDTPPVLGVSDAKALSPRVDGIVFVVQWERTKRDAAQAAVKELRDVAAPVVGAVLNQVDLKRHAYYGYGDAGQYYRKYSKYYRN